MISTRISVYDGENLKLTMYDMVLMLPNEEILAISAKLAHAGEVDLYPSLYS